MKLEYIREYLDLTETLNYSVSSRRLYISQPTLTRHIQAMEKELGFALINTSSHNIWLTKAGTLAIPVFRKMISEYDSYLQQCINLNNQITGSLKIGLLYYAMDDYFSEFITYMEEKYPHAEFSFFSYQPEPLYHDLKIGKIDVASLMYDKEESSPSLLFQKIGTSKLIAMMRDDHPLSTSDTITLQELSAFALIELKKDNYSNKLTRKLLEKNHIHFSNIIFSDNIETVPITIRKTGGIHLTGESCRRQHAASISYKEIIGNCLTTDLGFMALRENDNPLIHIIMKEASHYFK